MPYPSTVTRVHLTSSTNDPREARVELYDAIGALNDLITELNGKAGTFSVGEGLQGSSGTLSINLQAADNVTLDFGTL
jgi:hypothetical protein|tara:strand:+ start:501 stop:734 length:234 start_codon:yes stop_codon:yes gene_type:complete